MAFEFPINSNESRRRASSRGSNFSESSRRSAINGKSTRSRIGASPLTYKGFQNKSKISNTEKDPEGRTVADNYKHGPPPSERMIKFNSSQVPLTKNNNPPG